jgi:hypothetical protein
MFVAGLNGARQTNTNVVDSVVGLAIAIVVGFRSAVSGAGGDTDGREGSGVGQLAGGRIRFATEAPGALVHIVWR